MTALIGPALLAALRTLLPRACPGCSAQLGPQPGLCPACHAALRPQVQAHSPLRPRPEPHLVTLGPYSGVRRRAVRELKFAQARDLAALLGGALASGVPAEWDVQAVVPVPLHPARQRQRGFNQAELLGRALAGALAVPCVPALTRTRATAQQARRHGAQREDLRGAFRAHEGFLPTGAVLLVDDVLTTGFTALACQDALLQAGAAQVYVAVVAR
ncbi:ComF family protein [Deinococcus radiotolerans]|uniref:Amidophosphoribosyltransferase n=1 Tax=Deinococcus radiotolerans TaxID=1309407 RepID=A0ABQ2FMW3_9DEIO|nr:ComF family protein [Deinococcus radiotolerans]GGL07219.1 amidophosphoribosyltransferase [Deinococcus radiotolerans]